MHYNFIKRSSFQEMTNSSSTGSGRKSYYTAFKPIEKFSIRKKELHSIETLSNSADISKIGPMLISNPAFSPYKNYLDASYPNFFIWNSNSSVAIVELNKGDGIVLNSINYTYNNISGTGSLFDFLTTSANERYPAYYKKVGYLQTAIANSIKGYILYGDGICILFNDAANSLSSWESGDFIQYSSILDQHELSYSCAIDGNQTWSTSNNTYWSSINQTDSAITSSLTSFWLENNYSGYSISGDAKDWMIIEKNDYPLFITNVGLYNEKNECLAVATLSEPFKMIEDFDITFLIKFKF
jgi:hypothetical protein